MPRPPEAGELFPRDLVWEQHGAGSLRWAPSQVEGMGGQGVEPQGGKRERRGPPGRTAGAQGGHRRALCRERQPDRAPGPRGLFRAEPCCPAQLGPRFGPRCGARAACGGLASLARAGNGAARWPNESQVGPHLACPVAAPPALISNQA